MRAVLLAAVVGLIITLVGTPLAIRFFRGRGYGQLIRDDGPDSHLTKRGTPTMGGAVIIAAAVSGYLVAHIPFPGNDAAFTPSGLLVLFVMVGLGVVGFLDDFIKIRMQRSLGLNKTSKLVGQFVVAVGFGILALQFKGTKLGITPASVNLSFVRDTTIAMSTVGFVAWAYLMISATSNGVNLTDGLDGLASGTAAMAYAAYTVIAFWQNGNACKRVLLVSSNCYPVRDPFDVAILCAAAMGACFGFLWWNAAPAKIFMGDTGSLAIGGSLAAIAIVTRTELLLLVIGGLFVVETLSVIIQVVAFRVFKRRVFNMAPMHHHFELAGWPEITVIVRFWIVAGLAVAFGLGLFYADWLSGVPKS
ncbi:MAG: phospho-N-acetylmuramoyl-pentapeptide-transferase [Frankiaceae bacterium]|nr:phospho-N-acetylmuramoyl-pentapeptide-transferase [Frankiaceae bacterium]